MPSPATLPTADKSRIGYAVATVGNNRSDDHLHQRGKTCVAQKF
jgi:hypothetical protein